MTKHQIEISKHLSKLAEEQVLFLKNRFKMKPQEIMAMYGGRGGQQATYSDAVEQITEFNLNNARKNGFVAS